ncbi:MAG: hypothetical protein ABI723_26335 [Bacteroidia bacterium]
MEKQILSTSSFSIFLKKYLFPVLLLIAVSGYLFSYFFEQKIILGAENDGAYKVNRIINEIHPDEIALLGSSRCESNYVPGIISHNAFNYGLSGAQDNVLLFFLEEEVKKNKHTPIIINMDPDGLNNPIGDISYYLYNANYPPVKKLLDTLYKFRYVIPFLKYYGSFEIYTKYYLNNKLNVTKITDHGGSFEGGIVTPEKFNVMIKERLESPLDFKNDSVLAVRLRNILIEHPERKFVFVFSPSHWSYMTMLGKIKDLRAFMNELRSYKNVRVFNMSLMPYPDSLFTNTMHLNYTGSKLFSSALRDSLKTTGIIQ